MMFVEEVALTIADKLGAPSGNMASMSDPQVRSNTPMLFSLPKNDWSTTASYSRARILTAHFHLSI